jgi:tellurite resistance protein
MSGIDWDSLASQAASQTDAQFQTTIASLTRMRITEIDQFIKESKITNANAIKVLKEINDAAASNAAKADAIANIDNGVKFLVSMASRIV